MCSTDSNWSGFGMVLNLLLLIAGVLFAVRTRNAKFVGVALGESVYLVGIIYNACVFAIIGAVINFMVTQNATIRVIFTSILLSLVTTIVSSVD